MASKIPQISFSVDVADDSKTEQVPKAPVQRPIGIGRWLAITQTAAYRQLVPGDRPIADTELFQHRSPEDMWMALPQDGKLSVFDVTEFSRYHPGGLDILLEHAGTDATEAYRMAHSYVNVNMIEKFRRGFLHRSQPGCARLPNQLLPTMIPSRPPIPVPKKPKWNWTVLDDMNVNLIIEYPQFQTASTCLSWVDNLRVLAVWFKPSTDPIRGTLTIRTLLDDGTYHRIALRLIPSLAPRLSSMRLITTTSQTVPDITGTVLSTDHFKLSLDLVRTQPNSSTAGSSIGSVLSDTVIPTHDPNTDESFVKCRVLESRHVDGSRYHVVRLCWSADTAWMPIPLGHHIVLRLKDENGHLISRPYTPVTETFGFSNYKASSDQVSATTLCLLVKIYPQGQMSQLIAKLKTDDEVEVSPPLGSVAPNFLTRTISSLPASPQGSLLAVFMLSGGSGITPMLRVLELLLLRDSQLFDIPLPTVHLICFDRTPADQVLVDELNDLSHQLPDRLSVLRVLSDASSGELGDNCVTGTVSDAICRRGLLTLQLVAKDPSVLKLQTLWLICGPLGFNNAAVGIAKQWGVPDQHIIQFKG